MAELDPGSPDELVRALGNWLREANGILGGLHHEYRLEKEAV
jgi:hypothetical protein